MARYPPRRMDVQPDPGQRQGRAAATRTGRGVVRAGAATVGLEGGGHGTGGHGPAGWGGRTVAPYRARRAASIVICPNALLAAICLTALVFVSFLGRAGVIIFLLSGLLLILRRADASWRAIHAHGWLLLLPLWCVASALWSEHPDLSARHGTQVLITFVIAAVLATRLSPTVFLKVTLLGLTVAGTASLVIGDMRDDGVWIGIFESKNYYAFTMVVLLLASCALLVGRRTPIRWRLAGLGGAGMALPQIVMAESLGAAIAALAALGTAVVVLHVQNLPPPRRARRMALLAAVGLGAAGAALSLHQTIVSAVIDLTGKDPTLTGRTDLWAAALDEIRHAPWLGTGYRGFWVQGNALAEALWVEFHIPSRSGFNFHNLFLESAVEIGLVGAALHLMLLGAALFLCCRWLLSTGDAPAVFFFTVVTFVAILAMVEVPVFSEFQMLTVAVLAGLVYGQRAVRELSISRPAPSVEAPA